MTNMLPVYNCYVISQRPTKIKNFLTIQDKLVIQDILFTVLKKF